MADEFWAVTFLFNAAREPRRLANYHVFRQRLGCPLLTVEMAMDGAFQLQSHDADVLLQFDQGDAMWQKERLFNIGAAHLPTGCTAVAMLDADILFTNPNWTDDTLSALKAAPVVQLFTHCIRLDRDQVPGGPSPPKALDQVRGVVDAIAKGTPLADCFSDPTVSRQQLMSWGFAWAYRRDLIERHGAYDAHIMFGGDTAIAAACFGAMADVDRRHRLSSAHRAHYFKWAGPWFDDVKNRVAVLNADAYHLWHGSIRGRYTADWHAAMGALAFDPVKDLIDTPGKPWRWAGNKPALENLLNDYFAFRQASQD
ncbi:MAG: hypothetical protein KDE14_05690 [Rhodobacteraceae bacterium]|nr:hypothetical protein [Paracoccaceae bacterium]